MRIRCSLLVIALLCAGGQARSQNANLEALVKKARTAMTAELWEEALDLNKRVISRFGQDNPYRLYGAQFGTVYYRKGLCEMKLKRWEDAMRSFEDCYQNFPNSGPDQNNIYQKLALLKWGESAMGAEKWELALSRFTKFSDERNTEQDVFPQGSFHINLAICHYKLGQVPAGNDHLEIAIRNKTNFPTPETGIVAGFQAMMETAIAARDEQVLLDFIVKNRGELIIPQAEMEKFSGVFLKLAGDALTAGMTRSALALYQFVPDTGEDSTEAIKLAALALIHEQSGNVRGATAAYLQIVRYFPKTANRENHLYQLVRTASLIGEHEIAENAAGDLLREFPASGHLAEVRDAGIGFPDNGPPVEFTVPDKADFALSAVPGIDGFVAAIDFFQGRKYYEAKAAFTRLASSPGENGILAKFYLCECLRKIGDLDGMLKELPSVGKSASLGPRRLRQLEIDTLWDAVRHKNWKDLASLAASRDNERLPNDQRAQVAHCHGLALEALGQPSEALNAFNTAMTADAGASEEIARDAAMHVLRILLADPESKTPGTPKQKEAAAVATLFEFSLGAGMPLPHEFRVFLK
ncbi:tetratricopeptide repeat protein [Luteolibacter yonseiensis]|uniref:Tetratricopeptide repeat protein n=1 Tax=Luteolibacter yonseiensis TaxID=1144680 RepID=A0A934R0T1_9BACT|nr:tetratricopeptide repeat protein [Luteolibacter yonseiensis]MBK1814664.1 tetratricopeptide repeat protein [Luteolibacter yonseiensis]